MNETIITVPKGVRYISEWNNNFPEGQRLIDQLPMEGHYIMNKSITGCGYTEYCITNDEPTILCSPRLVLLKNKEDQHPEMENLLYVRNEFEEFDDFDRDINKDDLRSMDKLEKAAAERRIKAEEYNKYLLKKIQDHVAMCYTKLQKYPKFLVSYDSFRRVKEALGDTINSYTVVVDEFQSIFCDSRFKSDTENEFMNNLRDVKRVCFLSATPMMGKYLDMLDEFKDLPYYILDWKSEDPSRVVRPYLKTKQMTKGLINDVKRIIDSYKDGKFEKLTRKLDDGTLEEVYSKEAVIYVNSVTNLCEIIKRCGLLLSETNVLCAGDEANQKKIRDAFRTVDDTVGTKTVCIGTVPKKGEHHKMFTLCTRTVYLGADFYSTCARSFIFSDANVDCLSVDITLDLPQILGRQRLDENPWKNRAELYFKLNTKEESQEKFDLRLKKKIEYTEDLLRAYKDADNKSKHALAKNYKFVAKARKYKDDFVSVNEHSGSDLKPIFNNLVMISEMRAFEIQKKDYKDRFTVFSTLFKDVADDIEDVNMELTEIENIPYLADKYRYFCSLPETMINSLLPHLPESFTNYYTVLGIDRMKALRFDATDMRKEYEGIIGNQEIDIRTSIENEFSVGEVYLKSYIKKRLGELYESLGYYKTPKASDIEDYFVVKGVQVTNKKTGKRDHGYKLIDKKEDN